MPPSMDFDLAFPDDDDMPVEQEMDYASGYKDFIEKE